jgi:hypothetical protein
MRELLKEQGLSASEIDGLLTPGDKEVEPPPPRPEGVQEEPPLPPGAKKLRPRLAVLYEEEKEEMKQELEQQQQPTLVKELQELPPPRTPPRPPQEDPGTPPKAPPEQISGLRPCGVGSGGGPGSTPCFWDTEHTNCQRKSWADLFEDDLEMADETPWIGAIGPGPIQGRFWDEEEAEPGSSLSPSHRTARPKKKRRGGHRRY